MFTFFKKAIKMHQSEFDALAKPAFDHLMKWKAYVVECSLNYPMPSLDAVQAIERGTERMSSSLLDNIRQLDDCLKLNGTLFTIFINLEGCIHRFKSVPDGPAFQNLGAQVQKAEALLEKLKSKHITSSTGDTRKDQTDYLISLLKDADLNVRMGAAEALGKTKDRRAFEPLVASLKDRDEDRFVRAVAAGALGKLKDVRAVELLISALRDEDSPVRFNAAWALEEITGQNFGQNSERWQEWWEKNKTK